MPSARLAFVSMGTFIRVHPDKVTTATNIRTVESYCQMLCIRHRLGGILLLIIQFTFVNAINKFFKFNHLSDALFTI